MDELLTKHLIAESERLNADEHSDWSSIERLWRPYVAQDDIEAQFRLAYYYLFGGFDEGPQKRTEMEDLLKRAAEHNHPDAIYWLSHLNPNGAERDALLLRAGELGSLAAQRDLGALYATGDWTGPHDSSRAVDWYRRAAERGHADAQYNLGFMYLLGEGVPSDSGAGLRWLHEAAAQGDETTYRLLADVYRNGYYGVQSDSAKADHWDELFRKSEMYRVMEKKRVDEQSG